MYRPITMYQIVCDRCGEVFGGTDTCSALFSNKEVDIGDYSDWGNDRWQTLLSRLL